MRYEGHVACTGSKRSAHGLDMNEGKGRGLKEDLGVDGKRFT